MIFLKLWAFQQVIKKTGRVSRLEENLKIPNLFPKNSLKYENITIQSFKQNNFVGRESGDVAFRTGSLESIKFPVKTIFIPKEERFKVGEPLVTLYKQVV